MAINNDMQASVGALLREFGVNVKFTSVDGTARFNAKGAFVASQAAKQVGNSALINQQQSTLYVAAGRNRPVIGDFVEVSKRKFRVKSVDELGLNGSPVAFVLELT